MDRVLTHPQRSSSSSALLCPSALLAVNVPICPPHRHPMSPSPRQSLYTASSDLVLWQRAEDSTQRRKVHVTVGEVLGCRSVGAGD